MIPLIILTSRSGPDDLDEVPRLEDVDGLPVRDEASLEVHLDLVPLLQLGVLPPQPRVNILMKRIDKGLSV